MATVRCPTCGRRLEIDDQYLGQEIECGACGAAFTARADAPPPAPPPFASSGRRWDDEDRDDRSRDRDPDDRPPRRRRRSRADGPDLGYAADRVNGPATGLQVVGWIGVAISILQFGLAAVLPIMAENLPPPPNQPNQNEELLVNAAVTAIEGVIKIIMSIVVLIGAGKMKRLESHGFAMTAAILAMLPCISPCCLLGLPFGIMAIQALNDAEVRDAFSAGRGYSD